MTTDTLFIIMCFHDYGQAFVVKVFFLSKYTKKISQKVMKARKYQLKRQNNG